MPDLAWRFEEQYHSGGGGNDHVPEDSFHTDEDVVFRSVEKAVGDSCRSADVGARSAALFELFI